MHTHFGSAAALLNTFLGVLIAGAFWRLSWMHLMARFPNSRNVQGFARAALSQY